MSGPLLLPVWEQLAVAKPRLAATMRGYLAETACRIYFPTNEAFITLRVKPATG